MKAHCSAVERLVPLRREHEHVCSLIPAPKLRLGQATGERDPLAQRLRELDLVAVGMNGEETYCFAQDRIGDAHHSRLGHAGAGQNPRALH